MNLRKKITYAEIGDLIVEGIRSNKTPEEESSFLGFIEKALRTNNIKKQAIVIRKTKE